MVYTAYIDDKCSYNNTSVLYMKSFEKESDAYLALDSELMKLENHDGIFNIVTDNVFKDAIHTEVWIDITKDDNYEEKITSDSDLLKKFVEFFNEVQHNDSSEYPYFNFGVRET